MGQKRSTLQGLTAILLWSSTVALARGIVECIGPILTGATVYLAAAFFLAFTLLFRRQSFKLLRELPRKYVFGCGALFVVYVAALYLALGFATNRLQTLEVGLLNYLWPALTILFSLFILGQRASLWLIPGTACALSGVFLVLTQGESFSWSSFAANVLRNPLAYGLALLAAISWALYSNLARRWGKPGSNSAVLLYMVATGIVFFLLHLLRPVPADWHPRVVIAILFLGFFTAWGYLFWDLAMRGGDVLLVAACSYATPFLSTVASCLYLRVRPGAGLWLGCALIVVGSLLSWRSLRRKSCTQPGP